ncbi:hypothetical protein ACA910_006045 [Epithemia clementina (nom. ined.)]
MRFQRLDDDSENTIPRTLLQGPNPEYRIKDISELDDMNSQLSQTRPPLTGTNQSRQIELDEMSSIQSTQPLPLSKDKEGQGVDTPDGYSGAKSLQLRIPRGFSDRSGSTREDDYDSEGHLSYSTMPAPLLNQEQEVNDYFVDESSSSERDSVQPSSLLSGKASRASHSTDQSPRSQNTSSASRVSWNSNLVVAKKDNEEYRTSYDPYDYQSDGEEENEGDLDESSVEHHSGDNSNSDDGMLDEDSDLDSGEDDPLIALESIAGTTNTGGLSEPNLEGVSVQDPMVSEQDFREQDPLMEIETVDGTVATGDSSPGSKNIPERSNGTLLGTNRPGATASPSESVDDVDDEDYDSQEGGSSYASSSCPSSAYPGSVGDDVEEFKNQDTKDDLEPSSAASKLRYNAKVDDSDSYSYEEVTVYTEATSQRGDLAIRSISASGHRARPKFDEKGGNLKVPERHVPAQEEGEEEVEVQLEEDSGGSGGSGEDAARSTNDENDSSETESETEADPGEYIPPGLGAPKIDDFLNSIHSRDAAASTGRTMTAISEGSERESASKSSETMTKASSGSKELRNLQNEVTVLRNQVSEMKKVEQEAAKLRKERDKYYLQMSDLEREMKEKLRAVENKKKDQDDMATIMHLLEENESLMIEMMELKRQMQTFEQRALKANERRPDPEWEGGKRTDKLADGRPVAANEEQAGDEDGYYNARIDSTCHSVDPPDKTKHEYDGTATWQERGKHASNTVSGELDRNSKAASNQDKDGPGVYSVVQASEPSSSAPNELARIRDISSSKVESDFEIYMRSNLEQTCERPNSVELARSSHFPSGEPGARQELFSSYALGSEKETNNKRGAGGFIVVEASARQTQFGDEMRGSEKERKSNRGAQTDMVVGDMAVSARQELFGAVSRESEKESNSNRGAEREIVVDDMAVPARQELLGDETSERSNKSGAGGVRVVDDIALSARQERFSDETRGSEKERNSNKGAQRDMLVDDIAVPARQELGDETRGSESERSNKRGAGGDRVVDDIAVGASQERFSDETRGSEKESNSNRGAQRDIVVDDINVRARQELFSDVPPGRDGSESYDELTLNDDDGELATRDSILAAIMTETGEAISGSNSLSGGSFHSQNGTQGGPVEPSPLSPAAQSHGSASYEEETLPDEFNIGDACITQEDLIKKVKAQLVYDTANDDDNQSYYEEEDSLVDYALHTIEEEDEEDLSDSDEDIGKRFSFFSDHSENDDSLFNNSFKLNLHDELRRYAGFDQSNSEASIEEWNAVEEYPGLLEHDGDDTSRCDSLMMRDDSNLFSAVLPASRFEAGGSKSNPAGQADHANLNEVAPATMKTLAAVVEHEHDIGPTKPKSYSMSPPPPPPLPPPSKVESVSSAPSAVESVESEPADDTDHCCNTCGLECTVDFQAIPCSECREVYYCSTECAQWDWDKGGHSTECSKKYSKRKKKSPRSTKRKGLPSDVGNEKTNPKTDERKQRSKLLLKNPLDNQDGTEDENCSVLDHDVKVGHSNKSSDVSEAHAQGGYRGETDHERADNSPRSSNSDILLPQSNSNSQSVGANLEADSGGEDEENSDQDRVETESFASNPGGAEIKVVNSLVSHPEATWMSDESGHYPPKNGAGHIFAEMSSDEEDDIDFNPEGYHETYSDASSDSTGPSPPPSNHEGVFPKYNYAGDHDISEGSGSYASDDSDTTGPPMPTGEETEEAHDDDSFVFSGE